MPISHGQRCGRPSRRASTTPRISTGPILRMRPILTEALRTWQSYTRYWRDNFSFVAAPLTSPPNPFYDLTQQSNTLIPFTVKDTDIESTLCYNLIERQPTAGVWNGTDQFTINDLTQALQRRRDQFLVETGMVLTRTLLSGLVPPVGQVLLPDSVIDVRRASWIDGDWRVLDPLEIR